MTKQMPPVPPDQRSPKGTGSDPKLEKDQEAPEQANAGQQGRQGNLKQNTTNQGYQQDR